MLANIDYDSGIVRVIWSDCSSRLRSGCQVTGRWSRNPWEGEFESMGKLPVQQFHERVERLRWTSNWRILPKHGS